MSIIVFFLIVRLVVAVVVFSRFTTSKTDVHDFTSLLSNVRNYCVMILWLFSQPFYFYVFTSSFTADAFLGGTTTAPCFNIVHQQSFNWTPERLRKISPYSLLISAHLPYTKFSNATCKCILFCIGKFTTFNYSPTIVKDACIRLVSPIPR